MCSPTRRRGTLASCGSTWDPDGYSRSQAPGVGNSPGATAFRRMPFGPHSTARLRVIATIPALAAAEGAVKADPVNEGVVATLRTVPGRPAWIHRFPHATVQ